MLSVLEKVKSQCPAVFLLLSQTDSAGGILDRITSASKTCTDPCTNVPCLKIKSQEGAFQMHIN